MKDYNNHCGSLCNVLFISHNRWFMFRFSSFNFFIFLKVYRNYLW